MNEMLRNLNISGNELIYEEPGDAQRGNPLDIVSIAELHTAETVTGRKFTKEDRAFALRLFADAAKVKEERDAMLAAIRLAVKCLDFDHGPLTERDGGKPNPLAVIADRSRAEHAMRAILAKVDRLHEPEGGVTSEGVQDYRFRWH